MPGLTVAREAVTDVAAAGHDAVERRLRRLIEVGSIDALDAMERMVDVHAEVETEVLYPACRRALAGKWDGMEPLLRTLADDHELVPRLVAGLRHLEPGDHAYRETLAGLRDVWAKHRAREEGELLPALRAATSRLRLVPLGRRMARRYDELLVSPDASHRGPAPAVAAAPPATTSRTELMRDLRTRR